MPLSKKRTTTTRFTRSSQSQVKKTSTNNQSSSESSNLKWNLQKERILSQLISLYNGNGCGGGGGGAWEDTLLTDVTLFSSDGESIPAHKVILMLSSPFFHKLFTQINKSQKNISGSPTVIVLGNVNSSHLRTLIRLIYTSQCVIPSNDVEEFQKVAQQFGVEGLLTSSSPSSSSPSKSKSQSQSDVIKVHIIDQRSQPDLDQHNQLDLDDSSMEVTPTRPCKTEPSDDTNLDVEDNHDHLSNFSDDLSHHNSDDDNDDDNASTSYVPPKSRRRASPSTKKLVHTWLKLDPPPSPSNLKSDWRIAGRYKYATFTGHTYYCAQGYKQSCPAEIKSKTLHDGTIFWFKNDKPHDNHKPPNYQFGLTDQQKDFVVKCLESGVAMPKDIFLKMELEGIKKPSRIKLAGMLQRYRKKNPDKIWKRLATTPSSKSVPRRIRKFSKKVPSSTATSTPRKRGRPPKNSESTTSSSTAIPPNIISNTTILSSTTGQFYETGHHPNHYPSHLAQLSFPPIRDTTSSLQSDTTSNTESSRIQQNRTYQYQNF